MQTQPRSLTKKYNTDVIFWLTLVHVMSIVAIPFFTWDAFAVCIIMLFTLSPIGVNLTYHRLLTHRSMRAPKWFEYVLASIGAMTGQGPPMIWVAEHRRHHRFSDSDQDPHNARRGFFWVHMGHLLHYSPHFDNDENWLRYVPDMRNDKYYQFLNKYHMWYAFAPLIPLYLAGGVTYIMWGGFVRVTLMLHFTWFVNSATHMWGYRTFETRDLSRNNWWVGLIAAGEGWHNNHHAFPSCARHGWRWWEFDLTYMYIKLFETFGLLKDVKRPESMPIAAKPYLAGTVAAMAGTTPEPATAPAS